MTDGRFSLKRIFLRLMIASIALSAALGILGILTARYGWFDLRILLTTVTIGVASISGLACGVARVRPPNPASADRNRTDGAGRSLDDYRDVDGRQRGRVLEDRGGRHRSSR
jgi:hypothetical protein